MEEKRVVPTYNGVKGVPGMEAGLIVATTMVYQSSHLRMLMMVSAEFTC